MSGFGTAGGGGGDGGGFAGGSGGGGYSGPPAPLFGTTGFGTANNNPPPPFGQPQQPQPAPPLFGTVASTPPPPPPQPSGFGTTSFPSSFGQPQQPPMTPFGAANNNNNNYNGPPAAGGFPAAPTGPSTLTFGASPNVIINNNLNNNNNNNNMNSTSTFSGTPFSGGPPGGGGFGTMGGTGSGRGFGGTVAAATPFGTAATPQHQQQQALLQTTMNNPFGGGGEMSAPPPSSNTFGISSSASTVATNNTTTGGGVGGGGFGQPFSSLSATATPWTPNPGFSNSSVGGSSGGDGGGNGFGTAPPFNNPFGGGSTRPGATLDGASSDDDMGSGGHSGSYDQRKEWRRGGSGNNKNTTSSASPFGPGSQKSSTFPGSNSGGGFGTPAAAGRGDGGMMHSDDDDDDDDDANEEEIRVNKAKKQELATQLADKRRRLEEAMKRKLEKKSGASSPQRPSSPTRPSSPSRPPPRGGDGSNLAERNALRFGQQAQDARAAATQNLLPAELRRKKHQQQQQQQRSAPSRSTSPIVAVAETGREDLENAVSLVGTCPYMCPDDELERRQNEGDLQALERVIPGVLHPPAWTLRDTAVKRFRRSAADYKLDVPEWVRPPDVLETTVAYLEEWIMERDRQGPDPRFRQTDIPPPSLDVYQFIWDRTRMVRKDFTLQNYVGTNGNCDARAVRCHERIARWHALCEHQLSHISDFVKMQSSQNITELGQTLKTLNELYDDSLDRSTVEVADDNGREIRSGADLLKHQEGCRFETIQGKNPVDYDGTALNNATEIARAAQRLIGKAPAILQLPAHGTAEPEMRALYILLTVNNEGGMEVLKYAARLFKDRPAVYHSPLVQLSIQIFKAIRDNNYAKFFSIMRDPSTPYLFCCIMFSQYVARMRKAAFKTMSNTYGGRAQDGQTAHDAYQLARLVHLLCFEDLEEAREACKFYNITVKQRQAGDGSMHDVIYWRVTRFNVPKDPVKGTILNLYPRKMIRTVESKLKGATRLAICRGEVSGEGAALSAPQAKNNDSTTTAVVPFTTAEARAKAQALADQQRKEMAKLERQQREQQEQKRQHGIERQRREKEQLENACRKKEAEQRKLDEVEHQRKEKEVAEEKRLKEDRQRRLAEEERLQKKEEEVMARKVAEKKARIEAEEQRARLLAEEARKQKEIEERQRREEAELLEKERQRKLAEERRLRELEEERRRKEEEKRLQRELEAKQKRDAEERRKLEEWHDNVDAATKLVVWRRWRRVLSRQIEMTVKSRQRIRQMESGDTTGTSCNFGKRLRDSIHGGIHTVGMPAVTEPSPRDVLEALLQRTPDVAKFSVAGMVMEEIHPASQNSTNHLRGPKRKVTLLLKIAIIVPTMRDIADESWSSLISSWIGSRIELGIVDVARLDHYDVRTVIVVGSSYKACRDCDVALFVIPPHWAHPDNGMPLASFRTQIIGESIPRLALVLTGPLDNSAEINEINNFVAKELDGGPDGMTILCPSAETPTAFDSALNYALKRCVGSFVHKNCVFMDRIPIMDLATITMVAALQECAPTTGEDGDEDLCVECARAAMSALLDHLSYHLCENRDVWSLWPPAEFVSSNGIVPSYFWEREGLPKEWLKCLRPEFLAEAYAPLENALNGHFQYVFQRLLAEAPTVVLDKCASLCAQGLYRSCLEKSLMWIQESSRGGYLYLPSGLAENIVDAVLEKVQENPRLQPPKRPRKIPKLHLPSERTESMKTLETTANMDQEVEKATAITGTSPNILAQSGTPSAESNKNKRSRSSEGEAPVPAGDGRDNREKRRKEEGKTRPGTPQLSAEMQESQAFSSRLEQLLHGDTVDLTIGGSSLKRHIRNAPPLDTSGSPKYRSRFG